MGERAVLLVEDDSTAAEARDLAGRRNPDLLLVDYRLPDMLGTELVRALRRAGVVAPVVLMPANPERGFNEAVVTLPSAEPREIP